MNLMFSLRDRALMEIAAMLWNDSDVRDMMSGSSRFQRDTWQKVKHMVQKSASKINLPKSLKEKLILIVEPMGSRILTWIKFHMYCNKFVTDIPVLFFTSQGTIDKKKTVYALIKDEAIDIVSRFQLACIYCVVEDFPHLWCQENGLLGTRKFSLRRVRFKNLLELYWYHYLKGDDVNTYENMFEQSALNGYEEAARYFCLKLNPQNSETLRLKTIKRVAMELNLQFERFSDVFYFLWSTLNADQQREIFDEHLFNVLKSFLVWPRQSLFLEKVKDERYSLSEEDYEELLLVIEEETNCTDSYLRKVFGHFWQQIPEFCKQYITDAYGIKCLLNLHIIEDEINMKLILNDFTISNRKKFIFGDGRSICKYLISEKKWDSVKYIIKECLSSPQEIMEFIDFSTSKRYEFIFSETGRYICKYLISEEMWGSVKYIINACLSSSEEISQLVEQLKEYMHSVSISTGFERFDTFLALQQWNTFISVVRDCIIECTKNIDDKNNT